MNRQLLSCIVFLGLAALAGCGARSEQPDGVAPTPTDPAELPVCAQVEKGQQKSFESEGAFREAITGVWTLCSSESVFCSAKLGKALERGLEIETGGRWYKLYEQDGKLVRGQGFDQQGTWEVIDTSMMNGPGVYQLNLNIDGGGSVVLLPAIAIGPRKMRLNNMGVCEGDYAIEP
ncbi:MAG: hypothetical protein MUF64_30760 [Polyangiaceae bacterium]|jgi:hypothetical protein|nr:hypothetical protein [Polyangiaceae bacterium]